MSYSISLSVQANLVDECPDVVLAYLRHLGSGSESAEPTLAVQELIDHETTMGSLPDPGWFAAPFGHVALDSTAEPSGTALRLYGTFHDEFNQHLYQLLNLVARHAADAPFAVVWTSMETVRATTFFAHDGVLFGAETGQPLRAYTVGDTNHPVPFEPLLTKQMPNFFGLHGLDAATEASLLQAALDDPVEARYLLARSMWRAAVDASTSSLASSGEPIPEDVALRVNAAVEAAVAAVARVLDDGTDPLALPSAPGWDLVETSGFYRPKRRVRVRSIDDLGAMLSLVDGTTARVGPASNRE